MTPIQVIEAVLVMCFVPIGLKCISAEGMILEKFGTLMNNWTVKLPEWLRNPIWGCPRCMAPWIGGICAILVLYTPWYGQAIPIILTAIGAQECLDR